MKTFIYSLSQLFFWMPWYVYTHIDHTTFATEIFHLAIYVQPIVKVNILAYRGLMFNTRTIIRLESISSMFIICMVKLL